MRVIINNSEINIPSSLADITVGQRISFQIEHGDTLDAMAKSISEIEDADEKELEQLEFAFEKMFRTFSFFSGVSVDVLKESEYLDTIANLYYANLKVLFDDELSMEPQTEFVWRDETWVVAAPELKHGDKMQFGELIDAKQIVKDLNELGKSHWESLVPLCAVYLRKPGEKYDKSFLYEDSDRLLLMRDLPMDIALNVGFFLTATMNIYLNTLQSSNRHASTKKADSIQKNISPGLVG